MLEQGSHVSGRSHVEALRNPLQRHGRLSPQPRRDADLARIALAVALQLLCGPAQRLESLLRDRLRLAKADCRISSTIAGLILREQVFQVRLGEAAGEAFLAEHIGDGLGLALLQLPDLVFHGAG